MAQRLQKWVFKKIHGNHLVYNTCWEDPVCDKELMDLGPDNEIVMITSAGCNALSYLLDDPKQVHCIDMNPKQNALLELKKAFYRADNFTNLFKCFGSGKNKDFKAVYKTSLRHQLPEYAKEYWDRNLHFFSGKGIRKSFYFHGSSGFLAWSLGRYLKFKKNLYSSIQDFFQSITLEQQAQSYQKMEAYLSSKFLIWLMNRHVVMSLAGVPKSQQELFIKKYENGTLGFLIDSMKNVFTALPARENYFWQVYFRGHYTEECCPEYLKRVNFNHLKENIQRVNTYTSTISEFLKRNPKEYSHFVLLDHQDWLAANDRKALAEEWRLILKNSRKGTKILLRSAAQNVDFFPEFVLENVHFAKEKTDLIHQKDRVGTYASTYLGVVK